MQAIMISIQPQWFKKILNGEKTIEIRKTMPKCELPCKVYIYCTKGKSDKDSLVVSHSLPAIMPYNANGKVVAEFTLNKIKEYGYVYSPATLMQGYYSRRGKELDYSKTCLKLHEIEKYANDGQMLPKPIYAWHIDDLVVYDKPKKLSEFYSLKKCDSCKKSGYESAACRYDEDCKIPIQITRPPQSWCYVEGI